MITDVADASVGDAEDALDAAVAALAAGAAMPDRVRSVGVLGGVAPTRGPDAAAGGIIRLAVALAPALVAARKPLGVGLTAAIRLVKPLAGPGLDLYAAVQPAGDKALLGRPEFKAMFLDDLLHGSRFQTSAPLNDLVLFTRDWGFAPSDVEVPVVWWHGDADHIVPFAHGLHMVERLPSAELRVIDGEIISSLILFSMSPSCSTFSRDSSSTSVAWSWMNFRRSSGLRPIRFSIWTWVWRSWPSGISMRSIWRLLGDMVVALSCATGISPKPLKRLISTLLLPLKRSFIRRSLWASSWA